MKTTRRDCLRFGALAGLAAASGCELSYESKEPPPRPKSNEERLLNRLAFGPSVRELGALRQVGAGDYIDRQLKAEEPEPIHLTLQLSRLDVLRLDTAELWDIPTPRLLQQLQQAAILRAAYSPNQLQERMVDFWTNHFNIYARKGNTVFAKGKEEDDIIRRHALGSFPAMLNAMAKSPCMLEYLDNTQNRMGLPNENYARELMELHSLGLHGGYSQRDVQEVARCFSGWSIETRFLHPKGRFRFDPDAHNNEDKTVLGRMILAGGENEGEQVLELLANHSATAKFVAGKISRYFLLPVANATAKFHRGNIDVVQAEVLSG